MEADLVLVDGDPLREIAALWRVKKVFARGREVAGHDRPNPYGLVELLAPPTDDA
jgi:imidazolonepropionase-like amidohydrolase